MTTFRYFIQKQIIFFSVLSLILASCSDTEKIENNKYDHSHSESIDMEKHLFEHEFAQQCINNESSKQPTSNTNQKNISTSCMCIAKFMFKDLATKDSYALLNDKKQVKLLKKQYKDASNHCL